jgi:hypothetical protein
MLKVSLRLAKTIQRPVEWQLKEKEQRQVGAQNVVTIFFLPFYHWPLTPRIEVRHDDEREKRRDEEEEDS